MSTKQLTPDAVIGRNRTEVDLKKTDYVLEGWDDTNDLIEKIEEYHPEAERIVETIEEQQTGVRPVMHMFGRTDSGTRVHVRVHGVEPYFYIPHDEYSGEIEDNDKVVDVEKGHENLQEEHVVKVFTRIPGDVPKVRNGYTHHEADILFPNRFLIDSGIEGGVSIPTEHATPEPTDITLEDLEPAETDTKTRVCFCDIEVDDEGGFPNEERAEREVTAITVYDNYIQDYIVYLYHPDLPDVTHEEATVKIYDDEERMLRSFADYITTRDFDAITGWNFSDFDARYLVNRLDTLEDGNDEPLVTKTDLSKLGSAYDDGYFGAKIKGMAVVDMLDAYQNLQFSELDSYSLEDVAQEELGTGKITDNRDLYELWHDDPQKLVDYNFKDVELTVMLEEKQGIIKFYEEIANYVGGRLAEVVDASKAVDIKVLRAVNGEWAVPSAGNVETEEFEGAKVFDPITGVKENVAVLDLKSLYPMSMKTINAGPETKDPEGELIAPNGIRFSNEEDAVVVEIIDEMLEERQKYKDLRDEHPPDSDEYANYDRKQSAIKVVMNTLYGVMGWDRFRLQDKDVGAAVTAVGREVIKFTEQVVEEMGYQSVYGDTDSVMIQIDEIDKSIIDDEENVQRVLDDHDVNSIHEFREQVEERRGEMDEAEFNKYFAVLVIGYEMEERINDRYDEFAKRELNADEHFFQIEFEKLYRTFFQAGKKKRYAGNITWKEGKVKDSIDIVGFEYKRSDYSKTAKQLMKRVFDHILRGGTLDDISEDVNNVIDKLKNLEYEPDDFGIPASVTQDFDDYDAKTMAVRGSEYANEHFDAGIQPGDKPKLNYIKRILPNDGGKIEYPMPDPTKEKEQPCCWMNFQDIPDVVQWDWEKYIDAQIKGPLKRILAGTDWSWGEVISGERQPRLGEYDHKDEASEVDSEPVKMKKETPTDDDLDDFNTEPSDPMERESIEAKKQLSQAQAMLEGYDDDEEDGDEAVEMNAIELDDGPSTIHDFM
jgi:DNA polymerase I